MMIAGRQAGNQATRQTWHYLHTQIETVIIDGWDGDVHGSAAAMVLYCNDEREETYQLPPEQQRPAI
jgi:hypothetical protein